MGRRRQSKRQDVHCPDGKEGAAEVICANGQGGAFEQHKPDPLVRIIALHPNKDVVALAVGPNIRIISFR